MDKLVVFLLSLFLNLVVNQLPFRQVWLQSAN